MMQTRAWLIAKLLLFYTGYDIIDLDCTDRRCFHLQRLLFRFGFESLLPRLEILRPLYLQIYFSGFTYVGIDDGVIITGNVVTLEASVFEEFGIGNTFNHLVEKMVS